MRADSLVDRRHHPRALPDLLLLAGVERRQDRPRAIRVPEPEALGPGGLLPDHLGGRQHVRRLREIPRRGRGRDGARAAMYPPCAETPNVPSAACVASGCTALCARKSENGFERLRSRKSTASSFMMSVM